MKDGPRGPDVPPKQPDQPVKTAADRNPGPPSDNNNDPRAVWRAMRSSDNSAFADPRTASRSKDISPTDTSIKLDTSKRIFSEKSELPSTSKVKVGEMGRRDELTARTLQVDKPRESPPIDKNDVEPESRRKSKLDRINEVVTEEIEDVRDAVSGSYNTLDQLLDRSTPTGQHTQSRSHDHSGVGPHAHMAPQSMDLGAGVAAMLTTGLAIGELAKRTYRKSADLREERNARNR